MPRQRFLWPSFWDDPIIGRLPSDHQLLFLSCVSHADDEGRLHGNPAFLKSVAFLYRRVSESRVRKIRDELARSVRAFHVYEVEGTTYVALLKWDAYQHPKYPKPSRIPSPTAVDSPNASPNASPNGSGNASGNDSSVGWVGLGWEEEENPKEIPRPSVPSVEARGEGPSLGSAPRPETSVRTDDGRNDSLEITEGPPLVEPLGDYFTAQFAALQARRRD